VQAGCDVGARVMVPMHWGTFRLSREPALEPIERIRAAWAAAGRDGRDLWDLAVGESRPLLPLSGLRARGTGSASPYEPPRSPHGFNLALWIAAWRLVMPRGTAGKPDVVGQ
jgi:hypothetical protein